MSHADLAKIERVHATRNASLGVDLYLDKPSGLFFANVGGKRIESPTKDAAVKAVREALDKTTLVIWRPVIVLRVDRRDKERGGGYENDRHVISVSCAFTYFRRERGANPLKPKETLEREHPIEFEERVAKLRKRHMTFGRDHHRKEDADRAEAGIRQDRATLRDAGHPYAGGGMRFVKEYELPYSEEAWAGIERIAQTLEDMQSRLDTFASTATVQTLAALSTGANILQLPPAPPKKLKGAK